MGQVSCFHWLLRCQLAAACGGGTRFQGCHGYLPFGLWLLLPANLLGTSSQAHLFVKSLITCNSRLLKKWLGLLTFNVGSPKGTWKIVLGSSLVTQNKSVKHTFTCSIWVSYKWTFSSSFPWILIVSRTADATVNATYSCLALAHIFI